MLGNFQLGVCMGRVEGIFWPNPPWWVKKNSTQLNPLYKSNPTHMGQVEPMSLTNFFFLLLNWVEKNININILKKT